METGKGDHFIQIEVDRAILEIRTAISNFAKKRAAPGWVIRLGGLLDKVECVVVPDTGDAAFKLDRENERVLFGAKTIAQIWQRIGIYVSEAGNPKEMVREQQLAINQFIVHELLHIRQNFPDFATVSTIKAGLPGYGLPLLDIAADTASAWIAALIEVDRLKLTAEDRLLHLTNALLRAYVIGSYVFNARKTPEKRQRAIGLLISAALVHAKRIDCLNREIIFEGWSEEKPILSFDLERQDTFNAFVMDGVPGLLVDTLVPFERAELNKVWDGVGIAEVGGIFAYVVQFLISLGVIKND